MEHVQGRKVVLVTGGAVRIGRALVLDFVERGWTVAVHHRRSGAAAEALLRQVEASGGAAFAIAADLSSEAETDALVSRVIERAGRIDALVNNASVFEPDAVGSVTRASWDLHVETNLRAPFVLSQEFARLLPEGSSGTITNILDQRIANPTPQFFSYTLSKFGLWAMTRVLAQALAPRIRVNAVAPGPTMRSVRQSDEQFRAQYMRTPLQRPTSVAEVCAAVRFVTESESVTGQTVIVDSGQHLGWEYPDRPHRIEE